jgi:DNA modification methylase
MTTPLLTATVSAPLLVGAWPVNSVQNVDALALLAGLPDKSVSSVISDPPYGVNIAGWDNEVPPQSILTECLRVSAGAVIWFGAAPPRVMKAVMQYEPTPDRILIWHVTFATIQTAAHGMFYRWHPIYCWRLPNQRIISRDVIECPTTTKRVGWYHPGTKPPELMRKLVLAFGGDIVCDPFAGSGTTLVAAQELGKRYIGCDISAAYCDIARRRLAQPYTPMLPLFAESA